MPKVAQQIRCKAGIETTESELKHRLDSNGPTDKVQSVVYQVWVVGDWMHPALYASSKGMHHL